MSEEYRIANSKQTDLGFGADARADLVDPFVSPDPAFACQALPHDLCQGWDLLAGSGTGPLTAPQLSHSPHPSVFSSSEYFLLLEEKRPEDPAWLLFTQANRPYSWSVELYDTVYEP